MEDLKKKREELLKSQMAQQKKIIEKLDQMKGSKSKEKDELMSHLALLTKSISDAMKKQKEDLEAKKKQKLNSVPAGLSAPAPTAWKKHSLSSDKDVLDRELELIAKSKDKVLSKTKPGEEESEGTVAETGNKV